MVNWPTHSDGSLIGSILRQTTGELSLNVISDQTRSGKSKTRMGHAQSPDSLNVVFLFNLTEWHLFKAWYRTTLKSGVETFAYPIIDDNTGEMAEYRIVSKPAWSNISGDILQISFSVETV